MNMFRHIFVLLSALTTVVVVAQQNIDNASPSERMLLVGDSYVMAGSYAKAQDLYTDALNNASGIDEKWSAVEKLVKVNIVLGDNHKSVPLLEDMLADDIAKCDSTMMMHVCDRMGYVYFCMKDYVRSIKSYQKGRTYMKGSADRDGKAELYANTARTLIVAGDVREAQRLLVLAEEQCSGRSKNVIANICELYANVYEQFGDFRKAFEYRTKQLETNLELWQNERTELMGTKNPWAYYQKVEQNVNNEKKIKELEASNAEQEKKIANMTALSHLAIVLFVILVIVLFVLAIANYNKAKKAAKLKETIEDNRRVLSIVSHDFVNPFNAIIGFSELQLQCAQTRGDRELIDYSRTIYESAQTLYQMFVSLLVWSQGEEQMKAKRTVLNVNRVVEQVIDIYKLTAEEKNIMVNVMIDDSITALVDETHLNIMLRNLIANSLKFTLNGGIVNISAVSNDGKTSIVIDDTGIGIPSEVVEKINNHEYVQSTIGTLEEKGVGLGLMICIDLANANGGMFGVDSVQGKGTVVTIVLDSK